MTERDHTRPPERREKTPPKRPWSPPKLTELGNLADVVRGGGGKLSSNFDGDGRKPPGSG